MAKMVFSTNALFYTSTFIQWLHLSIQNVLSENNNVALSIFYTEYSCYREWQYIKGYSLITKGHLSTFHYVTVNLY